MDPRHGRPVAASQHQPDDGRSGLAKLSIVTGPFERMPDGIEDSGDPWHKRSIMYAMILEMFSEM